MKSLQDTHFWPFSLVVACFVAFLLVRILIPAPSWWATGLGCGVIVVNSLLTRGINFRAIGRSRAAFLGWGIGANAIRMLTLFMFFAYITLNFVFDRGSFLTAGISSFFVMLPAEVMQLFRFQDRLGAKL